ncbi:MAG: MotA/TolQ/ExbB proton channel family protein [Gammaproteobacteria bacterium]|nr:MotA/TolQ/ExbB proton channel family protein [Gammaproteobacteria bacterium]
MAQLGHLDPVTLGGLAQKIGAPFKAMLEVPMRFLRVGDSARLSELLEEVVMRQVPSLDRCMWLLDTVVTLAPLLGLLGTIIGMFHAFQFMGNAAGNTVCPNRSRSPSRRSTRIRKPCPSVIRSIRARGRSQLHRLRCRPRHLCRRRLLPRPYRHRRFPGRRRWKR